MTNLKREVKKASSLVKQISEPLLIASFQLPYTCLNQTSGNNETPKPLNSITFERFKDIDSFSIGPFYDKAFYGVLPIDNCDLSLECEPLQSKLMGDKELSFDLSCDE